jgi:hypothetical protein
MAAQDSTPFFHQSILDHDSDCMTAQEIPFLAPEHSVNHTAASLHGSAGIALEHADQQ